LSPYFIDVIVNRVSSVTEWNIRNSRSDSDGSKYLPLYKILAKRIDKVKVTDKKVYSDEVIAEILRECNPKVLIVIDIAVDVTRFHRLEILILRGQDSLSTVNSLSVPYLKKLVIEEIPSRISISKILNYHGIFIEELVLLNLSEVDLTGLKDKSVKITFVGKNTEIYLTENTGNCINFVNGFFRVHVKGRINLVKNNWQFNRKYATVNVSDQMRSAQTYK
jgi:hypothetical protein